MRARKSAVSSLSSREGRRKRIITPDEGSGLSWLSLDWPR